MKVFNKKTEIYFDDMSSHVLKMSLNRVVLSLAVSMDLEVEHMDVKIIFLRGNFYEGIYMEHHEGFEVKGKGNFVFMLKKSL